MLDAVYHLRGFESCVAFLIFQFATIYIPLLFGMHFLNLVGLIKRELTLLNEIKPEIDAQLILDRDEKKKNAGKRKSAE